MQTSNRKFRFLLWQANPDGTWTLRSRSSIRCRVEAMIRRIPPTAIWRMMDLEQGLLAQSTAKV